MVKRLIYKLLKIKTMIKVRDLRVGNKVMYDETSTLFDVTEISATGIGVKNEEEETWIELDQFSPIKLTPFILEKAGFQKEDMEDLGTRIYIPISSQSDMCLSWSKGNIWLEEINTNIKYIHELQNLYFALTGEELQIEL